MAKKILVTFSDQFLKELDFLVNLNLYQNRSEAIRDAVRLFLENKKLEEIEYKIKKGSDK